eukprot:Awhi_evm1s3576
MNEGVPQSDLSSLTSFPIFINDLIEGIRGLDLDLEDDEINYMIQCLLYTDNCILVEKNIEDLNMEFHTAKNGG